MSYEITSESYGRRLPKITATATSTDDLATLGTDWAEGSTCTISDTTYKLDKVKGWVDPSSGGGGGSGGGFVIETTEENQRVTMNKTYAEIKEAFSAGQTCVVKWSADGTAWDSVIGLIEGSSTYRVIVWNGRDSTELSATSTSGYPSAYFGD